MPAPSTPPAAAPSTPVAVVAIAAAAALLRLPWLGQYGFHGDELYFVACGRRLAFGYVDHPPFIAWVARVATTLFGDAVWALRVLPLAAHAATVLVVAATARRLGAGRFGQALAALGVATAPVHMVTATFLNIPCFETLWWTLAACLWIGLLRDGEHGHWRWWALGAVLGLGLMTKHSTLLFGMGMAVGMAATPARRLYATRGPWIAAAVALVIFAPNLEWQLAHEWATLSFARHLNRDVMSRVSAVEFLLGQLLFVGPATAPLWLAGLASAWRDGALRPLAIAYLVMLAVLLLLKAKVYYLAPAYPMLLAVGATALERLASRARRSAAARAALVALLVVPGAAFSPAVTPVLPVAELDGYVARMLGWALASPRDVTQEYHRQVGWNDFVDAVAAVAEKRLTPEQRRGAVVITGAYSQAAALERWGPARGLPPVVSGHVTYWFWAREDWRRGASAPSAAIAVDVGAADLAEAFLRCDDAGALPADHDNPEFAAVPIVVCTAPRRALSEAWPAFRQ
jgi:4-amino-4-deoxy-L-arabinose transferase-like glycosyltransferase